MLNRFQRLASNYSYYGYINRYSPELLRKYQTGRHYYLGRKGAFDTLVYKGAADHINYEEDFNVKYKLPVFVVNVCYRVAWFWFVMTTIYIMFSLGDMNKLFLEQKYFYTSRMGE